MKPTLKLSLVFLVIALYLLVLTVTSSLATLPTSNTIYAKVTFKPISTETPYIKTIAPKKVIAIHKQPSLTLATAKPILKTEKPPIWNISSVTFYDFNTWGYNRPGGRSGTFACGGKYLRSTVGVAHKTLPCGTIIVFRYKGITKSAPVLDRGPGSANLEFDMTSELCYKLEHCFTGEIEWYIK